MNIWGILSIIVSIVLFIVGAVYKIDKHINEAIEIKYQQKVAHFMLKKQNQALMEWKINSKLFKENIHDKKQEIITKIEYIKVKDDSCEAKLEAIQELQNIIYSK